MTDQSMFEGSKAINGKKTCMHRRKVNCICTHSKEYSKEISSKEEYENNGSYSL